MNKQEVIKKYGNTRCQEFHYFLDKLNRYYSFPYSEENLYDFVVDLEIFLKRDLFEALRILKDRESTFPLKFNEIYNACKDARATRKRIEKISQPSEDDPNTPRPMPENIKKFINQILHTEPAGASDE